MKNILPLLVAFVLSIPLPITAQVYHFPVQAGKKCYLTGSVGEIRQNHFHMGLDIAVGVGTPVYAAADGYVRRLKTSTWGYGNVLYVLHPHRNEQSVYAHLERFNERIARFAIEQQIQSESFEIELHPGPQDLPIKKGEIIGYTGNTGQSGGPHLHYEIRTPEDITLNPMHYDFKEVPQDRLAPFIGGIALEPRDIQARVEGRFARQEYSLRQVSGGNYQIDRVIPVYGALGLEVLSYDKMEGFWSILGTTEIEVYQDGQKVYAHNLNKIDHEHNRSMNVHINYAENKRSRRNYQRCYIADGNRLNNYEGKRYTFHIQDEKVHDIKLLARDAQRNTRSLSFKIRGQKPARAQFEADRSPIATSIRHEIQENVLMIRASRVKSQGDSLALFFNGLKESIPLAYQRGRESIYLWNLNLGLPDMASLGGVDYPFDFKMLVLPGQATYYQSPDLNIFFPEEALFDTLFLEHRLEAGRLIINQANIVLNSAIEVSTPFKAWGSEDPRLDVYYQGRTFQENWVENKRFYFKTRSLGTFFLKRDNTPPLVKVLKSSAQALEIRISDAQSGIESYKVSINGKYLAMKHEHKRALLYYDPRFLGPLPKGEMRIEVQDRAGNRHKSQKNL